jgi:calpain-7
MSQLSQQSFFQDEVTHQPSHSTPSLEGSSRFTQSAEINKLASEANSMLAVAIDLDEAGKTTQALKVYVQAAESYLATIRLCEGQPTSSSIAPVLKRRLEGALDRIEQLKPPKPGGNAKRTQVVNQVSKEQNKDVGSVTTLPSLTKREIEVLKRSSLIASGVFLPWSDEEANTLSKRVQAMTSRGKPPPQLFVDPDGNLKLSAKQQKHFHTWARPSQIASMRKEFGIHQPPPTMIRSISPYSIRQQFVTDCSFIASLCICAAFEKRLRKRLVTSIIYPQDEKGIPMYNPEGKYMVKLWLNGVARQVVVDDRLPIDKNSNLLCSNSSSSREQLELWVSIIEKAYMKLCGGYDFPGSNR